MVQRPDMDLVVVSVRVPLHHQLVIATLRAGKPVRWSGRWSPRHVPSEIRDIVDRRGPDKVIWASDYPLLPVDRAANEGRALPLGDEAKRRYLRDNALEVCRLGGEQHPARSSTERPLHCREQGSATAMVQQRSAR